MHQIEYMIKNSRVVSNIQNIDKLIKKSIYFQQYRCTGIPKYTGIFIGQI